LKIYLLRDFLFVVYIRLTGRDERCRSRLYENGNIETGLNLGADTSW